jgi:hypothetical protein
MKATRWYILLGFVAAFSTLTAWAMFHQSPSDIRDNSNWTATFLTISGPLTGGFARPSQTGCWKFGWRLLPYCGAILAVGVAFQFCPLPFRRGETAVRIIAWVIGWLGWFGGSVLSLLYALS